MEKAAPQVLPFVKAADVPGEFLMSGRARIVIEGVGSWEIGPETAFYSPLGVKHRVENIGDEPLRIVWCYCPPLPSHCS